MQNQKSYSHLIFGLLLFIVPVLFIVMTACSEKLTPQKEEVSLIMTDTIVTFNPQTKEEEFKISRNNTPMTTQQYMKRFHGIEAEGDDIDSIIIINPTNYAQDMFIVDHKQQKVEKIIGYKKQK